MNHILVGIDFSEHSRTAAHEAVAIARRFGAEVTLAHVSPIIEAAHGEAYAVDSVVEAFKERRMAEQNAHREALGALRESLDGQGVDITTLLVDDSGESGLARLANDGPYDLVVVATHGRTGWRRALLGSFAERTVRLVEKNVFVSRGTAVRIHRTLVPIDFSPVGKTCLAFAKKLTEKPGHIELLHASGDIVPSQEELDQWVDKLNSALEREGQAWAKDEAEDGVEIRFSLDRGSSIAAVERAASRNTPDLIAVGSHGRKGLVRFFLGSVAERVVRYAPCSVLVVHNANAE